MKLVPIGGYCAGESGTEKDLQSCEGVAICKKYCVSGGEKGSVMTGECQYWCVNPDGISCNDHTECESEYCDVEKKICTVRKGVGETCNMKNECLSYICDNGKCSNDPQIRVQPTPSIYNDKGSPCQAEINYPHYKDYKGLLS